MNTDQARAIVKETFPQAFDKSRFQQLVVNLLNRIDEAKAKSWNSTDIKEAFKDHVKGYERLGTYTSPDKEKLDVLIVHLTAESKLERARTAIRNFVADHLKTGDGKDAALVAFISPTEKQWRFSYVKMEYAAVAKEDGKVGVQAKLTPARRSSYIVGENESCHTAQSRFLDLLQDTENHPTLAQIEDAFSVEAVTKEFFEQYKELFLDLKDELDTLAKKDKIIGAEFAAKNVSTADFAKKLMGQIVFLYFLQKKGWLGVPKGKDWGDGPHNFLRQLFASKFGGYKNFFNDILEPLFYDTLATDRGHDAWCKIFSCRIPFLNGGLFEPVAGYDWQKTNILIPNSLFSNTKTTSAGDEGTGILDVFDRYNFTVNEAEPLEKEVAIDPEMLGKVFENLLEVKERKSKGSFYTPREIVHYMCQESLINYLDTAVNSGTETVGTERRKQGLFGDEKAEQTLLTANVRKELIPRADLETFIHSGDQASYYEAARVEGTSYQRKLPKTIETHAKLLDDKLADIAVCDPAIGSGAFPVGMMQEIVRARSSLTPYFNDVKERTAYHFKRHAIQNCIYGVDIDPGAVEIAKLRLWLSLVVDEDDVKQIKPLPNLDYKIVVGNSLLGVEKNLFNQELFKRLEELKPKFFDSTDRNQKEKFKSEIDCIIHELTNGKEAFDFEIYFSEIFHRQIGFDILIANPPYGATFSDWESNEHKSRYESFSVRAESYVLFIEAGIRILRRGGLISYIVPDTYLNLGFTQKLRSFLLKNTILKEIFLLPAAVFEGATVDTTLLFAQRDKVTTPFHQANVRVKLHKKQCDFVSVRNPEKEFTADTASWQKSNSFNIASQPLELELINHIENAPKRIADVSEMFSGIKAYEVGKGSPPQSKKVLEEKPFTSDTQTNAKYSPFYDGKHIGRYTVLWKNNNWIKYGSWLAAPRNPAWFEGEKVLIRKIVGNGLLATYIPETMYCNTLLFVLKLKPNAQLTYKTILGILNSRLIAWYFRKRFQISDEDTFPQIMIRDILQFPIPNVHQSEQVKVNGLVDEILKAKRKNIDADTSEAEQQIDTLIYSLYGLSNKEIKIIET